MPANVLSYGDVTLNLTSISLPSQKSNIKMYCFNFLLKFQAIDNAVDSYDTEKSRTYALI